ncbi:MAG TPA: Fe-S protein assembly co-chaperone HscB [Polyangiaceae bacterium]
MDVFATLGIAPAFDVDLAAVEKVHRELSRALHPDKYIGASPSERRAALTKAVEVNEAWRVVRDPLKRADALLSLASLAGLRSVSEEGAPKADPEFLMDMLEQREALSDAKAAKDLEAVRRLASAIEARVRGVEQVLSAGFKVGTSASAADLSGLALKVGELKFYRRFLDEVSAIEDELAA